jgi:hypothetical protein
MARAAKMQIPFNHAPAAARKAPKKAAPKKAAPKKAAPKKATPKRATAKKCVPYLWMAPASTMRLRMQMTAEL